MAFAVLLTMLVVLLFFGLALDAGLWYFDHRWAQTQAESAALAAAMELPLPLAATGPATARADEWLIRNNSSSSERSCIVYSNNGAVDPTLVDTVRVCVRRPAPSFFSTLSSIPFVYVSASATARLIQEPSLYALMAMNESDCSTLNLNGGPIVNVTGGGGTYTRSSCVDALRLDGNAQLLAGVNDTLTGDARVPPNAELVPDATVQDYIDDPFGNPDLYPQPVPTASPNCQITNSLSNISTTRTLDPGTYCFEVRVNSGAAVTLNPGVYIFLNGLTVNGGTFTGTDVLLYSTCSSTRPNPCDAANPDATPGDMLFAGGATVSLSGRDDHAHMVIWVDRTAAPQNPDHPLVRFLGNTAGGIDGRVYNYHGTVEIGGTNDTVMTINMSVVADHIDMHGDTTFNIPYDPILAPPIFTMSLTD
jgi:Putative Flp pilus-assembly TadE/G-like